MKDLARLTPGVILEQVGSEVLVILPKATETLRLSGEAARVVRDIQTGQQIDSHDPVVSHLVDFGVIDAPGMSRRGLIKAGAIGAGAGIAVMAMPSVAAASSDPPGAQSSLTPWSTNSNTPWTPTDTQRSFGDGNFPPLNLPGEVFGWRADSGTTLPSTPNTNLGEFNSVLVDGAETKTQWRLNGFDSDNSNGDEPLNYFTMFSSISKNGVSQIDMTFTYDSVEYEFQYIAP